MASRATAALGGGYGLTVLVTLALADLLPGPRDAAGLAATLLSFAVFTAAVVWAFAAATARRAWVGLLVPGVLAGLVVLAHSSRALP